jgi:hypothetical protein
MKTPRFEKSLSSGLSASVNPDYGHSTATVTGHMQHCQDVYGFASTTVNDDVWHARHR